MGICSLQVPVILSSQQQTGFGAYPAYYTIDKERGLLRPGRDVKHSPPSSAEVKNVWSYTHIIPLYAFMTCTLTTLGYFIYSPHYMSTTLRL